MRLRCDGAGREQLARAAAWRAFQLRVRTTWAISSPGVGHGLLHPWSRPPAATESGPDTSGRPPAVRKITTPKIAAKGRRRGESRFRPKLAATPVPCLCGPFKRPARHSGEPVLLRLRRAVPTRDPGRRLSSRNSSHNEIQCPLGSGEPAWHEGENHRASTP